MKYLIAIATVLFSSALFAQKKNATTPAVNITEAMRQYRFADAENALTQQIAQLRKKKLDTTQAESRLRSVQRAKSKLAVTEQVTFIDSVVVPRSELFRHLYLGSENGMVDSYAHYFNKADSTGASVYVSSMGDHRIYAQNEKGHLSLYSCQKLGDDWSQATLLNDEGLADHGDKDQNFPFVLSDGATLYYAAKGEESMGGYDIFMTRYDADEHRYLAPENIGMPFNSPANDYLYAIDEFDSLGWFVTDRNQSEGNVCIYTFIPNTTRRIYDANSIGDGKLRSLAMLHAIKDTQDDKDALRLAQQRLANVRMSSTQTASAGDDSSSSNLLFYISPSVTYTSLGQFHNANARKQAEYLLESKSDLKQSESKLQQLRDKYASANAASKKQLATQILPLEQHVENLITEIKKQEKNIRQLEQQK